MMRAHGKAPCFTDLEPAGMTDFFLQYDDEPVPSPNGFVVKMSDAVRAAQEFLANQEMPRLFEWFEL